MSHHMRKIFRSASRFRFRILSLCVVPRWRQPPTLHTHCTHTHTPTVRTLCTHRYIRARTPLTRQGERRVEHAATQRRICQGSTRSRSIEGHLPQCPRPCPSIRLHTSHTDAVTADRLHARGKSSLDSTRPAPPSSTHTKTPAPPSSMYGKTGERPASLALADV